MPIKVGDKLPNLTLMTPTEQGPSPINLDQIFGGKTVALFVVPGAFTPTCSAKHLPGYRDKATELKAKGIDKIACLAVNDAFVMDAWAKAQEAGNSIIMLADGNGDFTKAVDMQMDASSFGMGIRSQRYAMVVENGIVKQLDVEEGGSFKVSSADHMLSQL